MALLIAVVAPVSAELQATLDFSARERYRSAMELHRLRTGQYPADPKALVEHSLLTEADAKRFSEHFRVRFADRGRTFTLESKLAMWQ